MGDANASIPTPQPVYMRTMFAAQPSAAALTSVTFVSSRCIESGTAASYKLNKRMVAVKGTRNVGKKDMILNNALPSISVDPETYKVTVDGIHATCQPSSVLPMAQRYFLF
jgi:urease subunit alpha